MDALRREHGRVRRSERPRSHPFAPSRRALRRPARLAAAPLPPNGDPRRAPRTRDTDLRSVWVRCHEKQKDHKNFPLSGGEASCAPEPYVTSLYWDGADNLIFRPLADALAVRSSGESVNVNSLDEVPD